MQHKVRAALRKYSNECTSPLNLILQRLLEFLPTHDQLYETIQLTVSQQWKALGDHSETYLKLAPLTILSDKLGLKQCLVFVRENTSGFLEDFT